MVINNCLLSAFWDMQISFLLIFYRAEPFDSCQTLSNSAAGIAEDRYALLYAFRNAKNQGDS
ncbi:hypothetical protein T06_15924 [Trichinella sp. T6]|nr:hypothetical protein T06_15924 [Trichinella sp. T6]